MKTISEVCKENEEFSLVVKAVVRRIGRESIQDVNEHGISGGFSGFIYYTETVAFWKKYKKIIMKMLENDASDFGVGIVEMVQNFNCLVNTSTKERKPDYTSDEIGRALYGRYNEELDIIYNALAWYAAEIVCRWFEE